MDLPSDSKMSAKDDLYEMFDVESMQLNQTLAKADAPPDYNVATSSNKHPLFTKVPDNYDKKIEEIVVDELTKLIIEVLTESAPTISNRNYSIMINVNNIIYNLPYSYMICNRKKIVNIIVNEIINMLNKDKNTINIEYIKSILNENMNNYDVDDIETISNFNSNDYSMTLLIENRKNNEVKCIIVPALIILMTIIIGFKEIL